MIRPLFITLLLAQLTACTQLTTPPQTTPATPQIALAQNPNRDSEYLKQIVQPINQTVAYFDENGKLVNQPVEYGLYRVHWGNTKNGDAVVQDFYQKTQTKQSDVIVIKQKDLRDFSVIPVNYAHQYIYQPNGDIREMLTFWQEGVLIKNKAIRYQNNRILDIVEVTVDANKKIVSGKLFNHNGALLADGKHKVQQIGTRTFDYETHLFDEQQRQFATIFRSDNDTDNTQMGVILYYDNGQKLYESPALNEHSIAHFWTDTGKHISEASPDEQSAIMQTLNRKFEKVSEISQKMTHNYLVKYPESPKK